MKAIGSTIDRLHSALLPTARSAIQSFRVSAPTQHCPHSALCCTAGPTVHVRQILDQYSGHATVGSGGVQLCVRCIHRRALNGGGADGWIGIAADTAGQLRRETSDSHEAQQHTLQPQSRSRYHAAPVDDEPGGAQARSSHVSSLLRAAAAGDCPLEADGWVCHHRLSGGRLGGGNHGRCVFWY